MDDTSAVVLPPEKSGTDPSFHKLSADVAQRKYRRHHSTNRSDSSSAEDGPECKMNSKRRRSHSPVEHKESHSKDTDSSGKKDNPGDIENESSQTKPCRNQESFRHSRKYSCGTSFESKRHDDYKRYHNRHADDDERSHPRTSRSDRESRADTYYDRSRRDSTFDRSRSDWRNVDGRYEGKSGNPEQRSKNKEKENFSCEHHRYHGEYIKYADGRKETNSGRGYGDDRAHGVKRDHYRVAGKCKDDSSSLHEDYRRYPEEKKSKNTEIVKREEIPKKGNGKEIEKDSYVRELVAETKEKRRSLFSSVGPNVESEQDLEKLDTSRKKASPDCSDCNPSSASNEVLDMSVSGSKEVGALDNVNAAKVAAMKAAELVNKNIGSGGLGAGRLSTDQKKKLLWGNKKIDTAEETTKRWDLNLFSDRERQEKFNKLMGVKDSTVQESKVDNKDGSSVEAKKREELDMDLEKHYIAGLRRRDGRTVGLGL